MYNKDEIAVLVERMNAAGKREIVPKHEDATLLNTDDVQNIWNMKRK